MVAAACMSAVVTGYACVVGTVMQLAAEVLLP